MEQLTYLQASRKGLKSHVTRIYNKIDSLIEQEADDYSIPLLTKAMEQLQDNANKLYKIDEQITSLINDPHELENYIVESEELNDEISDKLTRVKTCTIVQLSKKHCFQSEPAPNEWHCREYKYNTFRQRHSVMQYWSKFTT